MHIRNVNLNLLPVLQALLAHRSVTRAAEAMGVTQSTVSKALAQLRDVLNDPLLVREGTGYTLSSTAEKLRDKVEQACRSAESVFKNEVFDPSDCTRTFVLSMPDYGPLILLPAIRPALEVEAPRVSLRFTQAVTNTELRESFADFFLLPREWIGKRDMTACLLIQEELVYVKCRGREPTSEVIFSYQALRGAAYPDLSPTPVDLPARALVEQSTLLPLLSALLNARTLAPKKVVDLLMPMLPIEIDSRTKPGRSSIDLFLCWHSRFDEDPGHRWFRELLLRVFAPDRRPGEELSTGFDATS
jgi:LysR family transcriptional regulator, nod-box dependent transcriptional activator